MPASACGPAGLFSEEHDVVQRQLRGNLPQAFVHALLLESACRLVPALVLFTAAARFILSGVYELTGSSQLETMSGIVGLALLALAWYAALALEPEDVSRRTVLPVLRSAPDERRSAAAGPTSSGASSTKPVCASSSELPAPNHSADEMGLPVCEPDLEAQSGRRAVRTQHTRRLWLADPVDGHALDAHVVIGVRVPADLDLPG